MAENRAMTPNELARKRGVSPGKVLAWIKSGELPAVNYASDTSKRPQYRITPEALAEFERRRAVQPIDEPTATRGYRRRSPVRFPVDLF